MRDPHFTHYSIPPGKPRIAGELRLRVASSDDHASFEIGSDLLRKNSHPWTRSLLISLSTLYEKLREENLVPDDLDRALSTSLSSGLFTRSQSQILYTINDTFTIDFSNKTKCLIVITEQGVCRIAFDGVFSDYRDGGHCRPYTGASLCTLILIILRICRKCLGSI